MLIRIVLFVCFVGLTACSSARLSERNIDLIDQRWQSLLSTEQFDNPEAGIKIPEQDLFALPDHVVNYLDKYVASIRNRETRYLVLRDWIYDQFRMYNYDIETTSSTNELFNGRSINCLSFSILFVAAARHVDLPAQLQLVNSPPYWDLKENTSIRNQHVNVATDLKLNSGIYDKYSDIERINWTSSSRTGALGSHIDSFSSNKKIHVMDLNPSVINVSYKTEALNDAQAYALYYSNKSIESLFKDEFEKAFENIKLALEHDRYSSTAWNNLGVLLNRKNESTRAKIVFETALLADQENLPAKTNLASILKKLGETTRANELEKEVEEYRISNPYYHYALSEDAFAEGKVDQAIQHLADAVQLKFDEPQFYFSLARCYAKLGDYENTRDSLVMARNHAKAGQKARYTLKLNDIALASPALKH